LGTISFYTEDTTIDNITASIQVKANVAAGSFLGSDLCFNNATNGVLSEKMRIAATGAVGINNSNPITTLSIRQLADLNNFSSSESDHYALTMETYGGGARWSLMINNNVNKDLNFIYNGARKGYLLDEINITRITGTTNISFTGQHRNILNKNINDTSIGLIVSSSGNFINLDNSLNANINESLPICTIANTDNDIKVFGVISDKEDDNDNRTHTNGNWGSYFEKQNKNEQRMFINSLGEGAIWVCNKNGNLLNGEYISSSSVPGYGMKQMLNQNLLANHTKKKITCECDFYLTKVLKQKLKLVTTTETYQEELTEDVTTTTTSSEIKYDETLQKYIEAEITKTKTTKEPVFEIFNIYDSSGNLLTDNENNPKTHKVRKMATLTKTLTDIDYDANGDVQYEDDLDSNGEQQLIFPLDTRFLEADATEITETEYNTKLAAGEPVYIACFVGCTYHCG
jgi:hypothetical protein